MIKYTPADRAKIIERAECKLYESITALKENADEYVILGYFDAKNDKQLGLANSMNTEDWKLFAIELLRDLHQNTKKKPKNKGK